MAGAMVMHRVIPDIEPIDITTGMAGMTDAATTGAAMVVTGTAVSGTGDKV